MRSVIICAITLIVVIYVGAYVLLSLPPVQEKIKDIACEELSPLLGGKLKIDRLLVIPFSELQVKGVTLKSPSGENVVKIDKVAAGVDLWGLLTEGKIIINYAEISGLDANIVQKEKNGPLNIAFLLDALSTKDKNKKPNKFDVRLRNVVVRRSKASYQRPWMTTKEGEETSMSDILLSNLRIDLSIPKLKNDLFRFDIRNVQCDVDPGVELRGLSAIFELRKNKKNEIEEISVRNLKIELPQTSLSVDDISYDPIEKNIINLVVNGYTTPSDFYGISPKTKIFDTPWNLNINMCLAHDSIDITNFHLANDDNKSSITLKGNAAGLGTKENLNIDLRELKASITSHLTKSILEILPGFNSKASNSLLKSGTINVDITGNLHGSSEAETKGKISTQAGNIAFKGSFNQIMTKRPKIKIEAIAEDLMIGDLTGINILGPSTFSIITEIDGKNKDADGDIQLSVNYLTVNGKKFHDLSSYIKKSASDIHAGVYVNDTDVQLNMEADYRMDGANSTLDAFLDMSGVNTYLLGLKGKFDDSLMGFDLDLHTVGNSLDNLTGFLSVTDFDLLNLNGKSLHLNNLSINLDPLQESIEDDNEGEQAMPLLRNLRLRSDWIDANVTGIINPTTLIPEIKEMVGSVFPSLVKVNDNLSGHLAKSNDFTFDFEVKGIPDAYEFLDMPICPLTEIPIKGFVNTGSGKLELSLSTPHLRQGTNKLIRDTRVGVALDSFLGMSKVEFSTIYPAKKGDIQLAVDIYGSHDKLKANLQFNPTLKSSLKGGLTMESKFYRVPDAVSHKDNLAVYVDIQPSTISISDVMWHVSNGHIGYFGKNVSVRNFIIEHENQYVKIDGVASESPEDILSVKLNDIDLDYIFSILNINYVTFGGMATGEVEGRQLLTKTPVAKTKFLRVNNLSYNGAVLGNGNLASTYHSDQQRVGIYAVINDPLTRERRASIDGGIWITRDSLSFSFDANKVNLQLMKPFVSAFCSDLRGNGSGKCKLYGTFSDIDLVGDLKADTISMKIDFTNTWYHAGGDSVFMGKGLIEVKPLTLYDSEGHTAELNGWLRHRYFHEPEFNFKINNAKSILCYDTNEKLNPLWYGTIYGTGTAQISGRPGLVGIDMNMQTEPHSRFYYVISDAVETSKYSFLSFTDRRKEQEMSKTTDTIPSYLHDFIKKKNEMEEERSNVVLSLKGTVTNDAEVTLIMDPIAGDKITARGQGALQMDYNMDANDLRMIGTYTLDEGKYFFTLQDIIIKNFNIRPGSSIKFNGDPMDANLDITATYRVNTNLTDLDETFATDKEVSRTNVPVDAILYVDGPMTHPDIDFDIELPTLTTDVERKVKSIVSTNDMMSRQIIYLLALNRFYTPEYIKSSNSTSQGPGGGAAEMSSVASSTLSSQLSNILSNMTDKLAVAPSFRSDKGDFTDMEFDLALSSRLLNNRLLINGNFGYRDKQTSNTQFIGDFDIEYLLNRSGNLRLKAYNHFNDQSYYLRSALTTQGVGVVFRKDFDHLFNIRRREKNYQPVDTLQRDTITKQ